MSANLNRSKLHCDIEKAVSSLMEEGDTSLNETVSRVLNKYRHEFDQLLETGESNFVDQSD